MTKTSLHTEPVSGVSAVSAVSAAMFLAVRFQRRSAELETRPQSGDDDSSGRGVAGDALVVGAGDVVGAKGCGEGALAAVPAAIVNALADAGVPMTELPLTPERVWRRLKELHDPESTEELT